jgi:hypothetical protein
MRFILIIAFACLCSSCAFFDHPLDNTTEVGKTLWGSSTRALEEARDKAVSRTYDKPYWDCVRGAVVVAGRQGWVIFKKDEIKGCMVVMGVKGAVNTTETGIFFDELSDTQTRMEVSSLSTNAKRKVAKALFHGLDIVFNYLPPDPPGPGNFIKIEPVDTDNTEEHD